MDTPSVKIEDLSICNGISVRVVIPLTVILRDIIFLHGGGRANGKSRFLEWQKQLAEKNIRSLSFDFDGVDDSIGDMSESSLEKRINDASRVVKWWLNKYPNMDHNIYGVSMGGYVALGVVSKFPEIFSKLILQAPAAYSQKSHNLLFDDSFTQEIRKQDSWKDSYTFEWLQGYNGSTLFINAGTDDVIPNEITKKYKSIIDSRNVNSFVTISEMPHKIWSSSEEDKQYKDIVLTEILKFLNN